MSTSAKLEPRSPLSFLALCIGRVVGTGSVLLGVVALLAVTEVESDQVLMQVSVALLGLVGGLSFLFGLERPAYRFSRFARPVGWVMMAGFAMFPGMTWFLLIPWVLVALPAGFMSRRAGERTTSAV